MNSHVYDWSRDLFSSALFVPLAATGWTNRKSRDDRLDVRSNTDRATKDQARTGDLRCIPWCVGRSNCPVYTVRSGRFRSIGRSIARCIAPCKWSFIEFHYVEVIKLCDWSRIHLRHSIVVMETCHWLDTEIWVSIWIISDLEMQRLLFCKPNEAYKTNCLIAIWEVIIGGGYANCKPASKKNIFVEFLIPPDTFSLFDGGIKVGRNYRRNFGTHKVEFSNPAESYFWKIFHQSLQDWVFVIGAYFCVFFNFYRNFSFCVKEMIEYNIRYYTYIYMDMLLIIVCNIQETDLW